MWPHHAPFVCGILCCYLNCDPTCRSCRFCSGPDRRRTTSSNRLSGSTPILGWLHHSFVFVYHPAVIYKLQTIFEWFGEDLPKSRAMIDITTVTWGDLGWIMAAFILSLWPLTSALTGMEKYRLSTAERWLRTAAGILVLFPSVTYSGQPSWRTGSITAHRFLNRQDRPASE